MRYISTRGQAPVLGFSDVLLAGLATDGGLYVPEEWPRFSVKELDEFSQLDYSQLALRIIKPFIGNEIVDDDLQEIVNKTYARFDHPAIAPLKQLGAHVWLLELFHGPTLAFKDFAMQLLAGLFEYELHRRGERVTIIGATSGDTGAAAVEALRHNPSARVFMLHPHERVSEIQRKQMTTVHAPNIHNIAIEGTFDDCQELVKILFGYKKMREKLNFSAVNSINWVRIAAQCVYYFYAALALGAPARRVSFSVPTGNFGNVFAGYVAKNMGLPIDRLIIGSNRNDILTRFCQNGRMKTSEVTPTYSPSMDIQVSSNFERLLFELYERDAESVVNLMRQFKQKGEFEINRPRFEHFRDDFDARRFDDEETAQWIKKMHQDTGELLDPHSVIGVAAAYLAQEENISTPIVSLATAQPGKFPQAMLAATGAVAPLPPRMDSLLQSEEKYRVLPNDIDSLREYIWTVCR